MSLKINEFLVEPTSGEAVKVYDEYVRRRVRRYVKEFKLVKSVGMKEHSWTSLAIKFVDNLPLNDIINAVTYLHSDEYHGEHEGYHIFWYD